MQQQLPLLLRPPAQGRPLITATCSKANCLVRVGDVVMWVSLLPDVHILESAGSSPSLASARGGDEVSGPRCVLRWQHDILGTADEGYRGMLAVPD
jgi:hypothetical protein